jgi:hypothetical protein
MTKLLIALLAAVVSVGTSFTPIPSRSSPSIARFSAPSSSDFEKPVPVTSDGAVDPNFYNIPAEEAAELWTVSVAAERNADRDAGVPFLDSKSKDYFVDDVTVVISRDGGMGLELLELAGGRDDDYGLTIVSGVSGNAESAGVLSGDSIASIQVRTSAAGDGLNVKETREIFSCECRNFDTTIGILTSFPPEIDSLVLNLKRIRRWPKVQVVVEYPPVQCADGADNKETIELFAGENLRRALLNRGIVMEDGKAGKCDFCGGKCTVKVDMGMPLMNPMSTTEEKIMKNNPKCRVSPMCRAFVHQICSLRSLTIHSKLSCKTVVGYNMQEGNVRLKVNLNEWTAEDKKESSPFFSR